jgi:hypothetical protein
MDIEAHDKRIAAILGREDLDFDEAVDVFYDYLKAHLSLPCEVTGREDFRWEEFYVLGPGDKQEYESLKETQPSYTDHYELLDIVRKAQSGWMLFWAEDIGVDVRRISDRRKFLLGLSELKTVHRKSKNSQLLDDYCVWFVNNR